MSGFNLQALMAQKKGTSEHAEEPQKQSLTEKIAIVTASATENADGTNTTTPESPAQTDTKQEVVHENVSLTDEELQLLEAFRANLNHLSNALANPKYEIKPQDAVRAVGEIIRMNPNLAGILEPEDFQLIVRNTRAAAMHRAGMASESQMKREEKADLKRQASALLDDALSGQFASVLKPANKKPVAKPAISGDAFASMMHDFAKGNAASTPTPATATPPATATATAPDVPVTQSLTALFGKKKD